MNVELPESIPDGCHTLDMIITLSVRVCYVSAILGSETVRNTTGNFRLKSVCMVHLTTLEFDHFIYNSGK